MTCKARLEEAGVGWVVLLWHDLADVLDRDAAGDVKADLVGGGLVEPDGSLTARGEKARRAALSLLAERQVSPARIEALAGGDVARWAAMAKEAEALPDTDHSQACSCSECALVWGRAERLQAHAPELVRTAVPALCAEVARLRAALAALSEWHAIPEEIRDQVTADMLFAAPLQSESDRATTDAWEAGIRCLEAGRPRVNALELAERARNARTDTTDDVQAGSLGMTLAEAWERYAATPEQRETLAYKGALLFLSGFSCITGRVDDTARAVAGLLGRAGESEDGRRGAARALRDVALAIEGRAVPMHSAEAEIVTLRNEAQNAEEAAAGKRQRHGNLAAWWEGRAHGIQRALDCLAPYLPVVPRSAR